MLTPMQPMPCHAMPDTSLSYPPTYLLPPLPFLPRSIVLNQVAGRLCVSLSLPDDQCFDLLMGALGLGFVLSLAAAIPIFYACKLMECARGDGGGGGGGNGTVLAGAGAKMVRVLGLRGGGHGGGVARHRAWM